MEKYIPKSALVTEIERLKEKLQDKVETSDFISGEMFIINYFLTFIDSLQEEPVSNNYSALLPCIYNRTLEERVKYCKYCSAACEGRVKEPVSIDLELDWEDIPKIFQISEELKTSWWFRDNEQTKKIGTQVFWEEVLKRFKERKEK